MKTERMLGIITELARHPRITAKTLAERFEVSERTIHRDIDSICMAGIPVVSYPGGGGGIAIMEGFRLDSTVLTRDELDTIVTGLKGLNSVAGTADIERLLGKVAPQGALDRPGADVSIDLASHYKAGLSHKIGLLRQAIRAGQVVRMDYYSVKGRTRRAIEPYFVLYQCGGWYVYGYCLLRQDFRLFKLNRVDGLETTGERFSRRPLPEEGPNLDRYFNENESRQRAVLLIDRSMEYRVVEDYGCGACELTDEDTLRFTVDYVNPDWMLQYVLSFGGKARVLEPQELAWAVKEQAERMLERYRSQY